MSRIDDIKFNLNANVYANDGDGIAQEDVTYLLAENERLRKAIGEFVEKHFHGGSKANRNDYVALGIPTADIYKLREAIKN